MPLALIADRLAAPALMLAAAALIAWRPAESRALRAWGVLAALAAAYALALNLQPVNFPSSNFVHYYMGAKYAAPYDATYSLVHAAQGRPQIGMRDLRHPARLVRERPAEQRAYYLSLLRAAHVPFDPLAPLDSLAERARASGAVEAEARRVLAAHLPDDQIERFRRDARAIESIGQGPTLTLDYGYNGSPLYGLLRRLDPVLYVPLGRGAALLGLLGQLLGVALIAWLTGPALGFATWERVAVAGLVLASREFSGYAMHGLVFTELWAFVLIAVWGLRRNRPLVAGPAIAVAGMIKIFPFLLLFAGVVPLARSFVGAKSEAERGARRRSIVLLGSCLATVALLGFLSRVSGRGWSDFLAKIADEFMARSHMVNSVSGAALLATLGVPDGSPVPMALGVATLIAIAAMFWRPRGELDGEALARRALIAVAALAWMVRAWLNYYAIVPLLVMPLLARTSRTASVVAILAMAGAYALPDFNDPALLQEPMLHVLVLVPYLVIPQWLLWRELSQDGWGRRAAVVAAAAAVVLVAAAGFETWRGRRIQRLASITESRLSSGDPTGALAACDQLRVLLPGDARVEAKRASILLALGRMDDAWRAFTRAEARAPDDSGVRGDHGLALLAAGRPGEAAASFRAALDRRPDDPALLFHLARALEAAGDAAGARGALVRARELAPDEAAIAEALERFASR